MCLWQTVMHFTARHCIGFVQLIARICMARQKAVRKVEGDKACLVRACQMPAEPTRLIRRFKLKLQTVLLIKGTAVSMCCCLQQAAQ